MFLTLGLYIMPPDKVEVEPCFVGAALIGRAQAQGFTRNGESTMKPYFPVPIGFRRFKEPTNVSPVARNRSWSPQQCEDRRRWQRTVSRGLFDGTDVVSVAATPCSCVEITSNQVHMFVKHHSTNCNDELFPNTTFLSVNVTNVL